VHPSVSQRDDLRLFGDGRETEMFEATFLQEMASEVVEV
jgi:hypothetical protein